MGANDGKGRYLAFGFGLVAFGIASLPSIGWLVISFGVAHLALYPVRHQSEIVRPIMWGVAAFWIGFVLVGPIWCLRGDSTGTGVVGCRTLLGTRYLQGNPSYLPALIAGTVGAAIAVAVVRERLRGRDAAQP